MLHAQAFGHGAPVLFLHGLFGEGENLKSLAKPLGASWTIHLVDLPNHGQSPHTESTDYLQMSAAVRDYARTLEQPVAVLGHSMGGKVAMALSLLEPDLVSKLIVLDIAPRPYKPSHLDIIDALLRLDLESLESRRDAETELEDAIPSRQVRSFLLKSLVQDGDRYRWKLNLTTLRDSYDRILDWPQAEFDGKSFKGPARFVAGSESAYLKPDRDRSAIENWFPRASVDIIQGAGHWVHAEKPEEVLGSVRSLLGEP